MPRKSAVGSSCPIPIGVVAGSIVKQKHLRETMENRENQALG